MSDENITSGQPEGQPNPAGAASPPPGGSAPPPPGPGWTPGAAAPQPSEPGPAPEPAAPAAPAAPQPQWSAAPPPPPPADEGRRRHRDRDGDRGGPLWIGLVLVVFGLAVLLGQTIPGVSFWMLWPLIIVAAGVVQMFTRGHEGWNVNRLFDGLVTIAFGLVLLGNTTGVIGWSVWWRFIWLWPVLLIAAGIGIIGRAVGQRWIGIFGSILVILALGYAAATTWAGAPAFSTGTSTTGQHRLSYSAPLLDTMDATLVLDAGAGEVKMSGGDELVDVQASSPWGTPTASVGRTGSSADVRVAMSEGSSSVYIPGATTAWMDLKLSKSTPWDITVNSGAVSFDADLKDVPVSSLELKTGVSDSTFTFGEPNLVTADDRARVVNVKSGVSSVTLRFPEDAPVRIRFSTGLSGNDVPSGYQKVGDVWESPGFSESGTYWDVTIQSGVGSSVIETY